MLTMVYNCFNRGNNVIRLKDTYAKDKLFKSTYQNNLALLINEKQKI